jgi:hypothetical protein
MNLSVLEMSLLEDFRSSHQRRGGKLAEKLRGGMG